MFLEQYERLEGDISFFCFRRYNKKIDCLNDSSDEDKIKKVKMEIAGAYAKEWIIEEQYKSLLDRLDHMRTDITTREGLNAKSSVDT